MDCLLNTTTGPAPSLTNAAKNAGESAKPEAYSELEGKVADLFNASQILEMVMDLHLGRSIEKNNRHVIDLSSDDREALFFAMYQLTDISRALKAQYYAAFAEAVRKH